MTIQGKVQNVGFRFHTRRMAQAYQIHGFVKNQVDGSVYIEAEGEEADLNHFMLWCNDGPTWARVDSVKVQDIPVQNFKNFVVR